MRIRTSCYIHFCFPSRTFHLHQLLHLPRLLFVTPIPIILTITNTYSLHTPYDVPLPHYRPGNYPLHNITSTTIITNTKTQNLNCLTSKSSTLSIPILLSDIKQFLHTLYTTFISPILLTTTPNPRHHHNLRDIFQTYNEMGGGEGSGLHPAFGN